MSDLVASSLDRLNSLRRAGQNFGPLSRRPASGSPLPPQKSQPDHGTELAIELAASGSRSKTGGLCLLETDSTQAVSAPMAS